MNQEELQIAHDNLKKKVIEMLDCQQLYFKTRDVQVLKKSKSLESEVRNLCSPKQTNQGVLSFDFLAR